MERTSSRRTSASAFNSPEISQISWTAKRDGIARNLHDAVDKAIAEAPTKTADTEGTRSVNKSRDDIFKEIFG